MDFVWGKCFISLNVFWCSTVRLCKYSPGDPTQHSLKSIIFLGFALYQNIRNYNVSTLHTSVCFNFGNFWSNSLLIGTIKLLKVPTFANFFNQNVFISLLHGAFRFIAPNILMCKVVLKKHKRKKQKPVTRLIYLLMHTNRTRIIIVAANKTVLEAS